MERVQEGKITQLFDQYNISEKPISFRKRKCQCDCTAECNCKCTCDCRAHCVCVSPCIGRCGGQTGRNLVVSIDGTSNQFGPNNTNVVELHSRIFTEPLDTAQLKYYNCGIGTYVPHNVRSFKYLGQWFDNTVDLLIAWNFKKIVLKAYRWLSDQYKQGDKIFLFGFSRGAYQIRTLAAMIERVGLIHAGNQELIPFAYELYSNHHRGKATRFGDTMAAKFKETFSRDVRIHFVGVWDTVSSVGVIRGKVLPLTDSADHICIFRHAIALDERRVKYLPECVTGGRISGDSKEVWFPGSHSDIGGGLRENLDLNLSSIPLLWMENEATYAGLRLRPRESAGIWDWKVLKNDKPYRSLRHAWWILEVLPLQRPLYDMFNRTTRIPHIGKGRVVPPHHLIHISTAFKEEYEPTAFLSTTGLQWTDFLHKTTDSDFSWAQGLTHLERDLFDPAMITTAIQNLTAIWTRDPHSPESETESLWIRRLAFISLSGDLGPMFLRTQLASNKTYLAALQKTVMFLRKLDQRLRDHFVSDIAWSMTELAIHLTDQDDREGALSAIQEAVLLYESLARERPTACNRSFAISLNDLSNRFSDLGRFHDAIEPINKAVALCRELRGPQSFDPITPILALSLHNQSNHLSDLGELDNALVPIQEAVELRRQLANRSVQFKASLAVSLNSQANLLSSLGQWQNALDAIEEAVSLYRSLTPELPPSLKPNLAVLLNNHSQHLSSAGRLQAALESITEAVYIRKELAALRPTVFRPSLAISFNNLSECHIRLGQWSTALRMIEQAVEEFKKLSEKFPAVFNVHLIRSSNTLSRCLSGLGQWEAALQAVIGVEKLAKSLSSGAPHLYDSYLAATLLNISVCLSNTGQLSKARQFIEDAMQLFRALAQKRPSAFNPELARCLTDLSTILSANGLPTRALAAAQEAVDLLKVLAAEQPTVFMQELARSLQDYSLRLSDLGKRKEALTAIEESVAAMERSGGLTEGPSHLIDEDLAMTLNNLSLRLTEVGRRAEALTIMERSVHLYRQVAVHRANAFNPHLASSLTNLSSCLRDVGQPNEAHTMIVEAVNLSRVLAAEHSAYGQNLAMSLNNLSNCLADLGQTEAALITIRECETLRNADSTTSDADLAMCLSNLSIRLSELSRWMDALTPAQRAVDIYERLAIENPAAFNPYLAAALNNLSACLSENGQLQDAYSVMKRAAELHQSLYDLFPLAFRSDLLMSLCNLSGRLYELERSNDATSTMARALKLSQEEESEGHLSLRLALYWHNYAHIAANDAKLKDTALQAIEEALQLRHSYCSALPLFNHLLARSLNDQAVQLLDAGLFNAAIEAARRSVELYDTLPVLSIGQRASQALSLNTLAVCLFRQSQHQEALATGNRVAEILRPLSEEYLRVYGKHLAMSLNNLAGFFHMLKRHSEANDAIHEAETLYAQTGPTLHRAICVDNLPVLSLTSNDLQFHFIVTGELEYWRTSL